MGSPCSELCPCQFPDDSQAALACTSLVGSKTVEIATAGGPNIIIVMPGRLGCGVDGLELDYEDIDILSGHSFDYLLRSIDYFYAKGNHGHESEPTIEELRPVIRKMYQLIPVYDYYPRIMDNIGMVCHEATRPDILPFYDDSDKRIFLEMFLIFNVAEPPYVKNPALQPWKRFNEIIRRTENPQTDKIAARAIAFFVVYDGKNEFGWECLEVMDQLMEKIDMEAQEYKGLDIRKLIVDLEKIHTAKKSKKDIKQKAGKIMRFFEQFA